MEKLPKKEYWDEFLRRADIPEEFVDEYAQSFVNHRISEKILPKLNRDDLKYMGVTVVGDMKLILEYINHVTEDQNPQAASVYYSKEIEELTTALKDSNLIDALKMIISTDFKKTFTLLNELINDQKELNILRVEKGMATTGEIFSDLKDEYGGRAPPIRPSAEQAKFG